jgi:hypothetical protein
MASWCGWQRSDLPLSPNPGGRRPLPVNNAAARTQLGVLSNVSSPEHSIGMPELTPSSKQDRKERLRDLHRTVLLT